VFEANIMRRGRSSGGRRGESIWPSSSTTCWWREPQKSSWLLHHQAVASGVEWRSRPTRLPDNPDCRREGMSGAARFKDRRKPPFYSMRAAKSRGVEAVRVVDMNGLQHWARIRGVVL